MNGVIVAPLSLLLNAGGRRVSLPGGHGALRTLAEAVCEAMRWR